MDTIQDLLSADPLAKVEISLRLSISRSRFGSLIPEDETTWALALYHFATVQPWTYWDQETILRILSLLERDSQVSLKGLIAHKERLGAAFENLFRTAHSSSYEDGFYGTGTQEISKATYEFNPEYLRLAEHVFGHFAVVLSLIAKRHPEKTRQDLQGAITYLEQNGFQDILEGYCDKIRNALAHGEVTFQHSGIVFGRVHGLDLGLNDYLYKLDMLFRTCNAMAIAFFLFFARHHVISTTIQALPRQLFAFLATALNPRAGFSIAATLESDYRLVGPQLHILLRTKTIARVALLLECARVSKALLDLGANSYNYFSFDIDNGKKVNSLVTIKPKELSLLLQANSEIAGLMKAFDKDTQILWHNESRWSSRVRTLSEIVSSRYRLLREEMNSNAEARGMRTTYGKFFLRETKCADLSGLAQAEVKASLRNPSHAEDLALVAAIANKIVTLTRKTRMIVQLKLLGLRIPIWKKPDRIKVSIYKRDGSLRWLGQGGWPEGNLVCVAERTWGRKVPHVWVKKPHLIFKGCHLQFGMHEEDAIRLEAEIKDFVESLKPKE